jgi:hypothetical protein
MTNCETLKNKYTQSSKPWVFLLNDSLQSRTFDYITKSLIWNGLCPAVDVLVFVSEFRYLSFFIAASWTYLAAWETLTRLQPWPKICIDFTRSDT